MLQKNKRLSRTHFFTKLLDLVIQNELELFKFVILLFELEDAPLVLTDRLVALSDVFLKQLLCATEMSACSPTL
jgi:hypothetical protein